MTIRYPHTLNPCDRRYIHAHSLQRYCKSGHCSVAPLGRKVHPGSLHRIATDTRERSGESEIPYGVACDSRVDGLRLSSYSSWIPSSLLTILFERMYCLTASYIFDDCFKRNCFTTRISRTATEPCPAVSGRSVLRCSLLKSLALLLLCSARQEPVCAVHV